MLKVLIYEAVIKKEKLKMGGKLSTLVKSNLNELKSLLSTNNNQVNKQ